MGSKAQQALAVQTDFPFARRVDPTDEIEDCCLSRPVKPDHAKDLAVIDLETQMINCCQIAPVLAKPT